MIAVQTSGRKGSYGIYNLSGPELIDLADGMLEEVEPRAIQTAKDVRDLWFNEAKRLLNLRTRGTAKAGEPPIKRSGDLFREMRKLGTSIKGRVVSSGWSNTDPGANGIEFGFVDDEGRHHLPHPFVRKSFENVRAAIEARLERL